MAYQKSPEKQRPPLPQQPPPEMMTFDEQVVACEIEVDTFDMEIEGFREKPVDSGDYEEVEEEEEIQNPDDDVHDDEVGTSGGDGGGDYHHEYYEEEEEEVEEEVDANSVYLFDEDTSQIHEIHNAPHHRYHRFLSDELEDDEPSTSSINLPSTSTSLPSTSTSAPGPSAAPGASLKPAPLPPPPTHFQAHQRGLIRYQMPPNAPNHRNGAPTASTYYIRKNHGGGGQQQTAGGGGGAVYNPVHFQTQYTIEPLARSGRRVIKRTHAMMSVDEMETMMEDAQVAKRIQTEINELKKTNDEMKKEYEAAHRRLETINMVWAEAKQKQRAALQAKKELTSALTQARATHSQLVKQVNQSGPQYRFH